MDKFRFWCYKVLPLVYDDSLSYYEVVCKLVGYMNGVLEDVKKLGGEVDELEGIISNLSVDTIKPVVEEFLAEYSVEVDAEFDSVRNEIDGVANAVIQNTEAIGTANQNIRQNAVDISGLEVAVQGQVAEIQQVNTNVSGLENRVTEAENNIDAINVRLDNIGPVEEITQLQEDVAALQGDVTALQTKNTEQDNEIETLKERMDLLDPGSSDLGQIRQDIADLQTSQGVQDADISNLQGRMTTVEGDVVELEDSVDAANTLATTAKNTADSASTAAATANTTANEARTTANNANSTAANAQSTANDAALAAANAASTASSANAVASSANTKANTAITNSESAQNTANQALEKANEALEAASRGGGSNPNLLDNWFFESRIQPAVNQRGVTTAQADEYIVDRWRVGGTAGTDLVSISESGLIMQQGASISQTVRESLNGYEVTVTMHILNSGGTYGFTYGNGSFVKSTSGITSHTFTMTEAGAQLFKFTASVGCTVKALKIEKGNKSTYNENDIPNYTEQMQRCLRELYVLNSGESTLFFAAARGTSGKFLAGLNLPVPMRGVPEVRSYSSGDLTYEGSTTRDVSTLSIDSVDNTPNGIKVVVLNGGINITTNQFGVVGLKPNKRLILSCELDI